MFQEFKPKAQESRYSYLHQLVAEWNMEDSKGNRFHYKHLLHIEQSREHFAILKTKEGKTRKSGVECVAIRGNEIPYKKHDRACNNKSKQNQAFAGQRNSTS